MSERERELIAQLVWAAEQYPSWVEVESQNTELAGEIVSAAWRYMEEQGIAAYEPPVPQYGQDYSI